MSWDASSIVQENDGHMTELQPITTEEDNHTLEIDPIKPDDDDCQKREPLSAKPSETISQHSEPELQEERVILNSDPEYRFSPSLILAYVFLFHVDNYFIIILRRFLFFFILWVFTGYMAIICYLFYPSVLKNWITYPQMKFFQGIVRSVYEEEYIRYTNQDPDNNYGPQIMLSLMFIVPCIMTVLMMACMWFLYITPRDISKLLYWTENGKFFCQTDFPPKLQYDEDNYACRGASFQRRLFHKLCWRITTLSRKTFWKFWWHQCVCGSNSQPTQLAQPQSQGQKVLRVLLTIVRFPLSCLQVLIFVLPNLAVLTKIVRHPRKVLVRPSCCSRGRRYPYLLWLTFPLFITGAFINYLLIIDIILLYCQAIMFSVIDILRHSQTSLPTAIFAVSILVYIRMAFVQFEDSYRSLKVQLFMICQTIAKEAGDRGQQAFYNGTELSPLVISDDDQKWSIPREFFDCVCKRFMPYKARAIAMLLRLVLTLCLVAFLFFITIEYQFFRTFTAVGETFLTALLVSIPKLLGMAKSEGYGELKKVEKQNAILAFVSSMVTFSKM